MTADLVTSIENMQIDDEMSPNVSTIRLYASMGMIKDKRDWEIISQDANLDDDFIDIFADDLDWTILVKSRVVPTWLLIKHVAKLQWDAWMWISQSVFYTKTKKLFELLVVYCPASIDWKACTEDNDDNLKVLLKQHVWVDWKLVSENINVFNEHILYVLREHLDWAVICSRTSNLSESTMMEAMRYMDWCTAAETQYLSPNLIQYLLEHRAIDADAFNTMCHYQKIPDDIYDLMYFEPNWDIICHHQVLSEQCMEKYADHLNWMLVANYQSIGIDFYERFADELPITENVMRVIDDSPMVHPLPDMEDLSYPEVFFMEE
jgi:hypothetical protein